jgi:hypothetical protein
VCAFFFDKRAAKQITRAIDYYLMPYLIKRAHNFAQLPKQTTTNGKLFFVVVPFFCEQTAENDFEIWFKSFPLDGAKIQ